MDWRVMSVKFILSNLVHGDMKRDDYHDADLNLLVPFFLSLYKQFECVKKVLMYVLRIKLKLNIFGHIVLNDKNISCFP